jgi:hypothetical protein
MQMLPRRRAARGADVMEKWKNLVTAECHLCERHTGAVQKANEKGERSVDRKLEL